MPSFRRAIQTRRQLQASGPDAYGRRRVLPAMTGSAFLPAGTCPSCKAPSHPRYTCPQAAAKRRA